MEYWESIGRVLNSRLMAAPGRFVLEISEVSAQWRLAQDRLVSVAFASLATPW